MGDPSVEVTEESRDASQEAKSQAMEAISEGDADWFVDLRTFSVYYSVGVALLMFVACCW